MALFAVAWHAWVFAIALSVCCIILAIFGGYIVDNVAEQMLTAPGHDSDFVTQSEGVTNTIINMWYASLWIITFFGWVVAIQATWKKESTSRYLG